MADYYTHFSVAVRLHGKLAPGWAADALRTLKRQQQAQIDSGDDEAADDVPIDFEFIIENGCAYFSDDGATGNVEHVARFLQQAMALGYVQEPVAIQWAETCSRPRPDSFTGGGVVVTRRKLHWFVVPNLLEHKIEQLERRRRRRL